MWLLARSCRHAALVSRGHPAMRGRHGQQHVVAGLGLEGAEHGLDVRGARLDVDHLVAHHVAIERRGLLGHGIRDAHVGVAEDHPAAGDDVGVVPDALREQIVQLQVPRLERMVRSRGLLRHRPFAGFDDRRRDVLVVQQRGIGREAFLTHQLLVVEVAVVVAVLGVTLGRDDAELSVERHGSAPRRW